MAGIAILGFAYILSQFYRNVLAVLTPVLTSELGMSASDLSMASGAWFGTFALAQFPVGIWLDKYGPRKTASFLHGVFAAGGTLLFATATGSSQVIIAMSMIGIGCSPVLMSAYVIFARNFSAAMFATLCASFVAIGMIGSIVGAEPLAAAVHNWGWRNVSYGLTVISLFTSIMIYLLVTDFTREDVVKKGSYLDLFKVRQLWFLFPLIACSYAVPASVRGLWAGPYLDQVFGLDILGIGRIVLYISVAQIIGTVLYGPMDRIFNTRKWVVSTGNLFVFVACLWLALNPSAPLLVVTICLVTMGLFGSAASVQTAHGKAFIPVHIMGRGMTLLNFFSIGGVALMQFASGKVVEHWTIEQVPVTGFSALFGFYALFLGAAITIYMFSKDVKPNEKQPNKKTIPGLTQT